jgi:hypothetical protein
MPNPNPASPHKEAANAVLKASVGLAKADAEFPDDARDELLLGEEAVDVPYAPKESAAKLGSEKLPWLTPET